MKLPKDCDIDRLFSAFQKVAESKVILRIAATIGSRQKPYLSGVEMLVFIGTVQIIANCRQHELDSEKDVGVYPIAMLCGMQEANTSITLERLVQKGLLERKFNPEDRRSVYFELTERGDQMLSKLSDSSMKLTLAYDIGWVMT